MSKLPISSWIPRVSMSKLPLSSAHKSEEPTSKNGSQAAADDDGFIAFVGMHLTKGAFKVPEVKKVASDLDTIKTEAKKIGGDVDTIKAAMFAGVGLLGLWSFSALGSLMMKMFRGCDDNNGEGEGGRGVGDKNTQDGHTTGLVVPSTPRI